MDRKNETTLKTPAQELIAYIGQKRKILILCHNNPDPDSIASAMALKTFFFQALRRKAVIGYSGIVGRAENREMIKRLKVDMIHVSKVRFERFSVICLVDSQPRTGNNALPRTIKPHVVIDHHPLTKETTRCGFYDVRPEIGSVSTIMTEYLRELEINVDRRLATALYYGLKTDTGDLTRASTKEDLSAFNFLLPRIAPRILGAIENPEVPKSYYLKFADSIENSTQYKEVIISRMGKLENPDIAAEMADFLLRMKNIRWTMCIGEYNDEFVISVRTSRKGWWAGKVALRVLRGLGPGGGHEKAAGGNVYLTGLPEEERLRIQELICKRFLKALGVDMKSGVPLESNH